MASQNDQAIREPEHQGQSAQLEHGGCVGTADQLLHILVLL